MTPQFADRLLRSDQRSAEDTGRIRDVMSSLVDKSIAQCQLKSLITMADAERALSIMHLNFTKNVALVEEELKSEEPRGWVSWKWAVF